MKDKYKIISDPSKVNAEQDSKFTKVICIQMAQGDDIRDLPQKFAKLEQCMINKDFDNARIEVNNTYSLFFNILQKENLDAHALKYLVMDGNNYVDEDDAYKWLMTSFTRKALKEKAAQVKKKYIQSFN